jgi:hypothetical protein
MTSHPTKTCKKCDKKFGSPADLARHMARKRPCVVDGFENPGAVPIQDGKNRCELCGNMFVKKYGLQNHRRRCAKKPIVFVAIKLPVEFSNL